MLSCRTSAFNSTLPDWLPDVTLIDLPIGAAPVRYSVLARRKEHQVRSHKRKTGRRWSGIIAPKRAASQAGHRGVIGFLKRQRQSVVQRNHGTLTAGSGSVGFGTKLCGVPRTTAEMAATAMIVMASIRIRRNINLQPRRNYEPVHKKPPRIRSGIVTAGHP